jgi:hypothetical protein
MSEQSFEMIAKTFQGLEETLAQELTEPVIVVFGSLSFIGPLIPRIK